MHVLIVGQDGVRLCFKEIVVPHTKHCQQNGQILLQRCLLEVGVHFVGTGEQLLKDVKAEVDGNRQADGGPQTVASSHPVPELKHVFFKDTKLFHRFTVGRQGSKVLGHMFFLKIAPSGIACLSLYEKQISEYILRGLEEPALGRFGIGYRLLGSKGLRGDNKEHRFRIDFLEH